MFYQAKDDSIQELVFHPGKGWYGGQKGQDGQGARVLVGPGKVKSGTPLAAVTGGWNELRLFYVDKADLLKELYSDGHTDWTASESSLSFRALLSPFTSF